MKRELLRKSDLMHAATNRREDGPSYRSDSLRPANLTDNQEAFILTAFRALARKPKGTGDGPPRKEYATG